MRPHTLILFIVIACGSIGQVTLAATTVPQLTDEQVMPTIDEALNRGGDTTILTGDVLVYQRTSSAGYSPNSKKFDANKYGEYKEWAKAGYFTITVKQNFANEFQAQLMGLMEEITVTATPKALAAGTITGNAVNIKDCNV